MPDAKITDIEEAQLEQALDLLDEGFSRRGRKYWETALERLADRPGVDGFPRFGLLLTVDGEAVGILLMLASLVGAGPPRCNQSSWYVRKGYRQHSLFLLLRSQKTRQAVYLNVSPAPSTLSVVDASGYKPYTGGSFIIDARAAVWPERSAVSLLSVSDAMRLPDDEARTLVTHLEYGCDGLTLRDDRGTVRLLYRTKRYKGLVPMARFVYGDPRRIVSSAGIIMRTLLGRGILFFVVDAPFGASADSYRRMGVRLDVDRDIRYARGQGAPAAGDLRETEISVFGP